MQTKIFCRTTAKDVQSFYVRVNGKEYFLFNQTFRRSNKAFFERGVYMQEKRDYSKIRSESVKKTLDYGSYILDIQGNIISEGEYDNIREFKNGIAYASKRKNPDDWFSSYWYYYINKEGEALRFTLLENNLNAYHKNGGYVEEELHWDGGFTQYRKDGFLTEILRFCCESMIERGE